MPAVATSLFAHHVGSSGTGVSVPSFSCVTRTPLLGNAARGDLAPVPMRYRILLGYAGTRDPCHRTALQGRVLVVGADAGGTAGARTYHNEMADWVSRAGKDPFEKEAAQLSLQNSFPPAPARVHVAEPPIGSSVPLEVDSAAIALSKFGVGSSSPNAEGQVGRLWVSFSVDPQGLERDHARLSLKGLDAGRAQALGARIHRACVRLHQQGDSPWLYERTLSLTGVGESLSSPPHALVQEDDEADQGLLILLLSRLVSPSKKGLWEVPATPLLPAGALLIRGSCSFKQKESSRPWPRRRGTARSALSSRLELGPPHLSSLCHAVGRAMGSCQE